MNFDDHPIIKRFTKIGLRLGRPFLRRAQKAYRHYIRIKHSNAYHGWAMRNNEECFVDLTLAQQPLISVVVATYNTPPNHLTEMIYSVISQHYESWELILVNASTEESVRQQVREAPSIDTRIKVVDLDKNEGIAGNTNHGLAAAKGEYIAFLDHDDLLHPCALHCMAKEIVRGHAELIYSDEDKVNEAGARHYNPFFKPLFSPNLLREVNYINHLCVMKKAHIDKVGGLRDAFNGAQDYDLLLRVIDVCQPVIKHVPRVLYHWRAAQTSTARDISTKHYVFEAGTKTLEEHLKRNKVTGTVKALPNKPGFYAISYARPKQISLVIAPVEKRFQALANDWLNRVVKKIDTRHIQIVVGDWFQPKVKKLDVRLLEQGPGYWARAAQACNGTAIVCFQQALMLVEDDLWELAAVSLQPNRVAVAPIIVDKLNTIHDAGLIEDRTYRRLQGLFIGFKYQEDSFLGPTDWIRDVDALSLQCFAMSRQNFRRYFSDAKGSVLSPASLPRHDSEHQYVTWGLATMEMIGPLSDVVKESFFNVNVEFPSSYLSLRPSAWGREREGDD